MVNSGKSSSSQIIQAAPQSIRRGRKPGTSNVSQAHGEAKIHLSPGHMKEISQSIHRRDNCSSAARLILYILIVCIIAAIVFIAYRAIRLHQQRDLEEETVSPDGVHGSFVPQRRSFEGFEDKIAEEAGDDYDGKESRRLNDLEKQKIKVTQEKKVGTVMYFHMDGCGHCRRFDPTWKKFHDAHAEHLLSKGIDLASYESSHPKAYQFGVHGFPTIMFVDGQGRAGEIFRASRTVEELLRFAKKQAQ